MRRKRRSALPSHLLVKGRHGGRSLPGVVVPIQLVQATETPEAGSTRGHSQSFLTVHVEPVNVKHTRRQRPWPRTHVSVFRLLSKIRVFFRTSVSVFRLLSKIRVFFRTSVGVFRLLSKISVFFRTSVSVFRLLSKIRVFFPTSVSASVFRLLSKIRGFFPTSVNVFRLNSEIRLFFRHGRLLSTA